MTLWMFIVPLVLIFITAVIVQLYTPLYWRAVWITACACVLWGLPYFASLRIVFSDEPLGWYDMIWLAVSLSAGIIAGLVAVVIGLVFFADRYIQERDQGSGFSSEPEP